MQSDSPSPTTDLLAALMPHTVIVGAGMVGLTMAHRLRQAGHRITILERAQQVGGLTGAHAIGSVTWDEHYHVTLASDSAWRSILRDLQLDDSIVWKTTRTACLADGTLLPVSSPLEFLRFTPLSLVQRVRLGATLFWATKVKDGRKLEQISVESWLRKLSGDSAFDRFWKPLLRAKLGGAYTQASAAFIWATAQRIGKARKNGLDAEKFGYVPGGYSTIISTFVDHLRTADIEIRCGVDIASITSGTVQFADGSALHADNVVVTASAHAAARLVPSLSAHEKALLRQVVYQGVIDVSLLLPQQLCPFYLTYLLDETILTGVVDMSSLVDANELGSHGLVYLPRYSAPDDPMFDLSDEELVDRFTAALAKAYPSFDPSTVLASKVAKVREVFSVPTLGYSDRVMPFNTSVPGVWVANGSQIVNGTLNVDESVQLAERAVSAVLAGSRSTRLAPSSRAVAAVAKEAEVVTPNPSLVGA
jgi:protoporphyrinogen oxidase